MKYNEKPSDKKQVEEQQPKSADNNLYLLEVLQERLVQLGHQVSRHPQYLALIVDSKIEIATVIIDNPNNHPSILHSSILAIQSKHFPNGIEENVVGIGTNIEEKVNSVVENYIDLTFTPIINSLSCIHNTNYDFHASVDGKEMLWHSVLGNLKLQGQWDDYPEFDVFFEMIKDKLKTKMTSNKLNWLKIYIAKQADGTVMGECLFNNEPWAEGLNDIAEYAKTWNKEVFLGLKQFIMFRKCDAFDE